MKLARLSLVLLLAACSSRGPSGDSRSARDVIDATGAGREPGAAPPDHRAEGGEAKPAPAEAAAPYVHEDVSVQTVNGFLSSGKVMTLVDVREPSEYQTGHLQGAINLPWTSGMLQQQVGTLDKAKPIVVYCASGGRSNAAATYLAGQGFKPVYDMLGGISAWKAAGYQVVTN